MSNLLAAIKARDSQIANIQMEVVGAIADAPARFEAVDLYVTADAADRDSLERLLEIADRGCIMMNTLRGKLDIRIRVGVTGPEAYTQVGRDR
jgi:putative redox protein